MAVTSEYLTEMIKALRVSETENSKAEVTGLINAALADLRRQGVKTVDPDNALVKQAVKLYCKAHYGYDSNADRFLQCYEALSASMALDVTDYGEDGDTDG